VPGRVAPVGWRGLPDGGPAEPEAARRDDDQSQDCQRFLRTHGVSVPRSPGR
jgi:hypothetical protein